MTMSGVSWATAARARAPVVDRAHRKLGMQGQLFDERAAEIGVVVDNQDMSRLGHRIRGLGGTKRGDYSPIAAKARPARPLSPSISPDGRRFHAGSASPTEEGRVFSISLLSNARNPT